MDIGRLDPSFEKLVGQGGVASENHNVRKVFESQRCIYHTILLLVLCALSVKSSFPPVMTALRISKYRTQSLHMF